VEGVEVEIKLLKIGGRVIIGFYKVSNMPPHPPPSGQGVERMDRRLKVPYILSR
jgi:hypothetical protein